MLICSLYKRARWGGKVSGLEAELEPEEPLTVFDLELMVFGEGSLQTMKETQGQQCDNCGYCVMPHDARSRLGVTTDSSSSSEKTRFFFGDTRRVV